MTAIQGTARLGKDPVLKQVGEDKKPVCEFSAIFINLRKNKSNPDSPIDSGFWVTVSVWGKFAEQASRMFSKGDRIYIADGDIDMDRFQDKDSGEDVEMLHLNCNLVLPWTLDLESIEYKQRQTPRQSE